MPSLTWAHCCLHFLRVLQSCLLPHLHPVVALEHRGRLTRRGQDVPLVSGTKSVRDAELALLSQRRGEASTRQALHAQHGQERVSVRRGEVCLSVLAGFVADLVDRSDLAATLLPRSQKTRSRPQGARFATSASIRTPTLSRTARGTSSAQICPHYRGAGGTRRVV